MVAIYTLSNLITSITEKSFKVSAHSGFLEKHDVFQKEFSRLFEQKNHVAEILKNSDNKTLANNLSVINLSQLSNPVVTSNWFRINEGPLHFNSASGTSSDKQLSEKTIDSLGKEENQSSIVRKGKDLIWRNHFKVIQKNGTVIQYGYDIDLIKFHNYFSALDKNARSYAFVFDKKGTCIFHPDIEKTGQNVFNFSDMKTSDTIFNSKNDYTERVAVSEYLQLDVIRFIKPLKFNETNWYICVNFPKTIAYEDVNSVKKYISIIYISTTFLLLFIFYLFNRANKKEYLEKEALIKDKNDLLLENEKVTKEKALIQLQQLKEQINPHFLFNTLNSLYMLIDTNPRTAKKFTLNLSKIYRYLIDPPEKNLVPLSDELSFIEKYIFLQMTRFNEELQFSIGIEEDSGLIKNIPYLSLQICIENVIKHNSATIEAPLKTRIIVKKDMVIIANNLQKKNHSEQSNNFGLKYLQSIYNYYSKKGFKTLEENGEFICILPLID